MTQIANLSIVPAPLIQAIQASSLYLQAAQELMSLASNLDMQMFQMTDVSPKEDIRTDFFTDISSMDHEAARDLFLAIRRTKESVEESFSLLAPAAALLNHLSHTVTNLLPMVGDGQPFATVASKGILFHYHRADRDDYERSLAMYLGLSPFPLFGKNLDYEAAPVIRYLSQFGFGVFTFLHLACHPEMAAEGRLPRHILYKDRPRPIAPAPLQIQEDGSIVLA